jgi:recombination protein RecT
MSLVNAALKAAEDQLMPDGVEGAIVPYREGDGGEQIARWLPMIQGITKKVLQHPEIKSWDCDIVQEGDEFNYQKGTNSFLSHKKSPTGGRKRPVQWAYAVAHFVNGGTSIEVMNVDEISDVASKSKAKHGPWQDAVFYGEMCRKTVAKLHAKRLPKTGALELVLRRDEDLYDLSPPQAAPRALPVSAKAALDQFASAGGGNDGSPAAAPREEEVLSSSPSRGDKSSDAPKSRAELSLTEYRENLEAVLDQTDNAEQLSEWFYSPAQKEVRVKVGMSIKQYEELRGRVATRIKELGGTAAR